MINFKIPFIKHLSTIIIFLSSKVTRCFDSTSCGEDGFCNFDFNSDGFCELCGNFPNPETDCKEAGFITQMGENECKRACKGY